MEPIVVVFLGCIGLIAFYIGVKVTVHHLQNRQKHIQSMKHMEIELEREQRKTAKQWLDMEL